MISSAKSCKVISMDKLVKKYFELAFLDECAEVSIGDFINGIDTVIAYTNNILKNKQIDIILRPNGLLEINILNYKLDDCTKPISRESYIFELSELKSVYCRNSFIEHDKLEEDKYIERSMDVLSIQRTDSTISINLVSDPEMWNTDDKHKEIIDILYFFRGLISLKFDFNSIISTSKTLPKWWYSNNEDIREKRLNEIQEENEDTREKRLNEFHEEIEKFSNDYEQAKTLHPDETHVMANKKPKKTMI